MQTSSSHPLSRSISFRLCRRNELKITTVAHLKYASDEDLKQIGLSRPEVRRLRKFYDRYYPNGYLGKIKRLLQTPKPADMVRIGSYITSNYTSVWPNVCPVILL